LGVAATSCAIKVRGSCLVESAYDATISEGVVEENMRQLDRWNWNPKTGPDELLRRLQRDGAALLRIPNAARED